MCSARLKLGFSKDGYDCEYCSNYNDILTSSCRICGTDRPEWITFEIQGRVEIRRGIFDTYGTVSLHHETSEKMNSQEELFADLFNGYKHKPSVNAMSDLELRAHREELSRIALEAKACIYAVDDILKERKPKGVQGFSHNLNIDEASTDAINTIKERQKKLTGKEKILAGLIKLFEQSGMSHADAEREATGRMGAGAILARVKDSKEALLNPPVRSPLSQENGFTIKPKEPEPSKPIFNPFEKK